MGLSAEEVIRRSRRELEKARDRHEVVAALAPLRGRNAKQVAVALFELMVEFPDWNPLIADEVERLIELNPGLATKQRVFLGYTRAEALAILARQGHRWAVAALLTLHHDGFVREAAVKEAAKDRRAIHFVVNRYSDWVPEVAAAARRVAVPPKPKEGPTSDPGMWRWAIESARRIRGVGGEMLSRLLSDPEARKAAMQDPVAARVVLEEALALQPDDPLVAAGLASPHGTVRSAIAERLQPSEDSLPLVEQLLRDPLPAIRITALQMLSKLQPHHPGVGQARLDTNFRVRSQARLQTGGRDASLPFYRDSLPHPSAIEGIGETGKRADAALVTPFLTDLDPRRRRAAVRALAMLDTRETVPQVKALLGDPSPRVVREVIRALESLNATVDLEEVERLLSPSNPPPRALLAVADLMPRWQGAILLLRHATTPALQEAAAMRLEGWAEVMRVRSIAPRRDELAEFSRALSAEWLPEKTLIALQIQEQRWR
jgi:HEAT repeat protein